MSLSWPFAYAPLNDTSTSPARPITPATSAREQTKAHLKYTFMSEIASRKPTA
jgi:hypothetical protein